MIKIEEMLEKDSREVWMLQKECFSVPWSLESIQEMFSAEGYRSYVYWQGEKIVGYIGMRKIFDEADITNVAVHPFCRRQGIGKQLLKRLLQTAKDENICRIFLEVRRTNQAAIRLYEQSGFHMIDIRKNYYDKPREDAYIMVWNAGSM